MDLEKILGDKFDAGKLKNAALAFAEFDKYTGEDGNLSVNADTYKDYKSFAEVNNIPYSENNEKSTNDIFVAARNREQSNLVAHIGKNFNNVADMVGAVDKNTLVNLGRHYIQDSESTNSVFEKARKEVYNAKKSIEDLENAPDKYLAKSLKNADSGYAKDLINANREQLIRNEDTRLNLIINSEILHYDPAKFVKDMRETYKTSREAYEEAVKVKKEFEGAADPKWDTQTKLDYQKKMNSDEKYLGAMKTITNYQVYNSALPSEFLGSVTKLAMYEKAIKEAQEKAAKASK